MVCLAVILSDYVYDPDGIAYKERNISNRTSYITYDYCNKPHWLCQLKSIGHTMMDICAEKLCIFREK